jgi:uncharacterized sulfatase
MFETPTTAVWKRMYDAGQLKAPQTYFWEPKPTEELYDLDTDRWEVHNLAGSSAHAGVLARMRAALDAHARDIRDVGFLPEYELHRDESTTTPYDRARDPRRYDFESVYRAAGQASDRRVPLAAIRPGLTHADAVVRYWSAMGVVIRGADAARSARAELVRLLDDPEPGPRIVAAEALARFGTAADRSRAVTQLLSDANPVERGEYVAHLALYTLNQVPDLPADVKQAVQALPAAPEDAGRRLRAREDYLPRLKQSIAAGLR